jgi:hypothetical protein
MRRTLQTNAASELEARGNGHQTMSSSLLTGLIGLPTVTVVFAVFYVMWAARTSAATSRAALLSGITLVAWAATVTVLGLRGVFAQPDGNSIPPVGIALLAAFALMVVAFGTSASLRSLFTNQQHLIRLNVWRLVGAVFLLLMLDGQMPALWALPAGIGDIAVGATAFWVASRFATEPGRPIAIGFNLFGLADLVVAVGLGIMTSPGPMQVFHTIPTAELATQFPLVLVPTFLVPLACALHVVSLTQLIGGTWAKPVAVASPMT